MIFGDGGMGVGTKRFDQPKVFFDGEGHMSKVDCIYMMYKAGYLVSDGQFGDGLSNSGLCVNI